MSAAAVLSPAVIKIVCAPLASGTFAPFTSTSYEGSVANAAVPIASSDAASKLANIFFILHSFLSVPMHLSFCLLNLFNNSITFKFVTSFYSPAVTDFCASRIIMFLLRQSIFCPLHSKRITSCLCGINRKFTVAFSQHICSSAKAAIALIRPITV